MKALEDIKKFCFFILAIIFSISIWCQTGKIYTSGTNIPTNTDRLKIDYEIKNVSNPESNKLLVLDLISYELLRQENQDIEIYNAVTNYTIILYSKTKTTFNKSASSGFNQDSCIIKNE